MSTPEISVVLTVYKRPQYLDAVFDGLLKQTFSNWECLIIDNGSNMPALEAACQRYAEQDKRIRYIRLPENLGIPGARNRGIAEASAEFIAFHDDDDVSHPQRLEKQVGFLRENPEVAAVSCQWIYTDEAGKIKMKQPTAIPTFIQSANPPWVELTKSPLINTGTLCRRKCLQAVGGYDPDFQLAEDRNLSLRLAEAYPLAHLGENLLFYRTHGGNTSREFMVWQYDICAYVAAYYRRNNLPEPPGDRPFHLFKEMGLLPPEILQLKVKGARGYARRLLRNRRYNELKETLMLFNQVFSYDKKEHAKMYRNMLVWTLYHGKLGALPAIIKGMLSQAD